MPVSKIEGVVRIDKASQRLSQVSRFDYMPFEDEGPDGDWMVEKMVLTDEGFLKGRAIATNVGVFPYIMDDGTIRYELRAAEHVFHPDSVATLQKQLMTNNHPTVLVNSENAKDLSVGFTGDVRQDQYHLAPSITITDKVAVQDVQAGKRGLSCGYTADVIIQSGNWMGIHYDAIQINIRYNHLALVEKGRAGDAAKLKLDSADSVGVQQIDKKPNKGRKEMPKLKIDGSEYEVDAAVHADHKERVKDLATVKSDSEIALKAKDTEIATAVAKSDQLEEANAQLTLDLAEAKKEKFDTDQVEVLVKERMDLLQSAEKAGVEVKEDMSQSDIQKAVVLSVFPNAKEKLDSADEVYLKARFDGAVEVLADSTGLESFKVDTKDKKPGKSEVKIDKETGKEVKEDSDTARQRMIDNMQKGGK